MPAPDRPLTVAIDGNWPDLDDAIRFLTPGGAGAWGRTRFGRPEAHPEAHVLVLLNAPPRPMTLVAPPDRVWLAIGEPPTPYHRPLHVGQGRGTVVVTCDPAVARDPALAAERRYVLEPPVLRTWQVRQPIEALARLDRIEKSRPLSWITSAQRWMPGHRRRLAFLRAIHGRIDFDLYGRGFRPIEDKWQGLAPYRYSIAFENALAPGYFSEKLMDCFCALTMPIYVGAPDIERFFPAEAMVRIDPADPDAVERIREAVASDRRERALDALREARRRVLYERNMFARLDALIRARIGPAAPAMRQELQPVRLGPA